VKLAAVLLTAGILVADERPGLRCPGTAIDHPPQLLTSLDPFRQAVRNAGYTGKVVARITIGQDGSVSKSALTSPDRLKPNTAITDRLNELRFCPAVVLSTYKSGPMIMNVEVRSEQ
jgi:hypothetical protein